MKIRSEYVNCTSSIEGIIRERDGNGVISLPEKIRVNYLIFYEREKDDPDGIKIYDEIIKEMTVSRDSLKCYLEKAYAKAEK